MDLIKYLSVLVVFLVDSGDTGGHGGKHHDHVRIHLPKFIHHDHHTKVITIHHHHHKPEEEHHFHHHHLNQKPHFPNEYHFHNHHTKLHTTTKTVTKGKDHTHHDHHQGHHHHDHSFQNHHEYGHHGDSGHHSIPSIHGHDDHQSGHHIHNEPIPHYGPQSYDYEPPSDSFDEFVAFNPAAHSYTGNIIPNAPRVHGVSHTIKQVNVYDTLPGAIPAVPAKSPGYEVTEADENDGAFHGGNSLEQSYPGTYGFVRGAAPATHDPFAEPSPQVAGVVGATATGGDTFGSDPELEDFANSLEDTETFTSPDVTGPFSSSSPDFSDNVPSIQSLPQYSDHVSFGSNGFGSPGHSFIGATGTALVSEGDHEGNGSPLSYSRTAGIQQTINTGGVNTIDY